MAKIHVLSPETARLIAAGEVIDRPASALRELLDNAIDAGAKDISVSIESGGIASITVSDDGCGMSEEDLPVSILAHATSKIEVADDLLKARTLGFRGEALASIAAAARLEILSAQEGAGPGRRLRAGPGQAPKLEAAAARRGTSVTMSGLFERYPARRQFLKRPQAEASLCRQIFVERAAAYPAIAFRWQSGDQIESLPPSDQERRIAALYPEIPYGRLHRAQIEGDGFSLLALFADPEVYRKDRRLVQVFVNRRKVPEWGLMSVLEYAYSPWLPGGMKPCVFLFADVDPAQADFNIHPAKREVRLKNPEKIKSALFAGLRDAIAAKVGYVQAGFGLAATGKKVEAAELYEKASYRSEVPSGAPQDDQRAYRQSWQPDQQPGWQQDWSLPAEAQTGMPRRDAIPSMPAQTRFRYLGQALGPFLVFEMDEALYILDQHAAHERILYDRLRETGSASQPLLVPLVLDELGPDTATSLVDSLNSLEAAGYRIEREQAHNLSGSPEHTAAPHSQDDRWIVTAVPAILGDRAVEALAWLLSEGGDIPGDSIVARIACRAAVKDGDDLDVAAACSLIEKALALPVPRCPHGRPIWIKIDKERLYQMIGRLVH